MHIDNHTTGLKVGGEMDVTILISHILKIIILTVHKLIVICTPSYPGRIVNNG